MTYEILKDLDTTNLSLDEIRELEKKDAEEFSRFILESDDPLFKYKNGKRVVLNIKHMLYESERLYSERPAIKIKDAHDTPYRNITYKTLKNNVDQLGSFLFNLGYKGGTKMAVIGDNGYEWCVSYLTSVSGIGTCVPIDKELSEEEIENLLINSEAKIVSYSEKFKGIFENIKKRGKTNLEVFINFDKSGSLKNSYSDFNNAKKVFEEKKSAGEFIDFSIYDLFKIGEAIINSGDTSFIDYEVRRNDIATILYTSGTTGTPKGVMLTHRNFCAEFLYPSGMIYLDENDTFFSVLPVHHTYEGTCGFLIPLFFGASIAYCEGLKYIVKNLGEAKATIFLVVPLVLESLYKKLWANIRSQGKEKLFKLVMKVNNFTMKFGLNIGKIFFKQIVELFGGRLRILICGGAALDGEILDFFKNFGIFPIQGYGLTECAPICALNPMIGGNPNAAGYIFPPFKGKIIDKDENGVGEILVSGPNVFKGYYKMEQETSEVLDGTWFKTGDLGYMDEKNFVFITGRKKNVIITKNGKNVFPEEIEYKILAKTDIISEIMVFEDEGKVGSDTVIIASFYLDEEILNEKYKSVYFGEDKKKNLINELHRIVDEYNKEVPVFKAIRRLILRDSEFVKNTSKKIVRFRKENKEGEVI